MTFHSLTTSKKKKNLNPALFLVASLPNSLVFLSWCADFPSQCCSPASCITHQRKSETRRRPFVLVTETPCQVAMKERRCQIIKQDTERKDQSGDVGNLYLCQKCKLLSVGANEVELWPLGCAKEPGALPPVERLHCFHGFLKEERAWGVTVNFPEKKYRNPIYLFILFYAMQMLTILQSYRYKIFSTKLFVT